MHHPSSPQPKETHRWWELITAGLVTAVATSLITALRMYDSGLNALVIS